MTTKNARAKRKPQARKKSITRTPIAKAAPSPRGPAVVGATTKKDTVLAMLQREQGATIEELMTATGWQVHSVRGFLSGTVRMNLGLTVERMQREDGTSSYHVTRAARQ